MQLRPFKGSELKINRARKHIEELKGELAAFGEGLDIHIVPVGETEHHLYYTMAFNKRPPEQIPIIIGDAVHNLRAALDLMMGDVARALGVSPKEIKFPFAADRAAFDVLVGKQPYKRLGTEIAQALVMCGPFHGGNAGLRGLHDLDITDKHQSVIPTYVAAWGKIIMPDFVTAGFTQAFGIDFSQSRTPYREGAQIVVAKDIDVMSTLERIEGPPEPLFPIGSPFPLDPVLEVLEHLTHMVAQIVTFFADKVVSEGDGPGSSTTSESA